MDSRQIFGYGMTGADLSFTSHPTTPPIPNRLFTSLKFDLRNSPTSPCSSQFDCDTLTTISDSQEQDSLTESPPCNSSLESNSFHHQLSPSLDFPRDSLQPHATSILQDVYCSQIVGHALQELETALMANDGDENELTPSSPSLGENKGLSGSGQKSRVWNQEIQGSPSSQSQSSTGSRYRKPREGIHIEKRQKSIEETSLQGFPPGNLKQLLIECARALSESKFDVFNQLIQQARAVVSISGEPIQRLGAYMVEGLVARVEASGNKIFRALKCREPDGKDLLSYMQILYEICPYLKFGYMAANGAIAEACRNEDRIHIIDFQIAQGSQWITLLQALSARPSGAPHVRITGIDDPVNQYARGDGLNAVAQRLAAISKKFNIPLEFHPVPVFAPDVTREMLDVRPGEALAVNFPLQLHHIPDESVDVTNPRDELLRMVKSLSPKVITLVEQESNINTTPFLTRFIEALEYYSAVFESIDVTMPRDRKERINVEQHCLAREIVNIIACEGKERVERHELLGKWKSRFMMAGFRPFPLSSYVNSVIQALLQCYSEHYTLVEKDGAMLLGWKERNLISASAWH
ncbi:Transcription factor GRAS [Dillenia turbinata]|uniref:Transcription factor GRAS n=1 Tax=Dillenia turbinata TaxID=194707 RepID=A0AAN8W6F5_9MAGN